MWSAPASYFGHSDVAFCDLDRDGDQWPDLVVGNSGEPCVKVFYAVPSTTPVPADSAPRAVALRIHDAAGRLVRVLGSGGIMTAGRQEIVWDGKDERGRDAPTGSYVAQLKASTTTLACKLLLVR